VIIFGGAKLADLGGSMGRGIKEFKKNIKDEEQEEPAPPARTDAAPPPVANVSTPPAAPSNAVQAIKCPSCEALNPTNAKMCNQCGASLVAPVS
jgi:sec-independent protein translocase protein TatA